MIDFTCGLKIASSKSHGNSFVKRSAVFYWLVGIVIAAILITAAFYFDNAVRDFVAQHQNLTMRNFMRNVSRFGDWLEHFALGLVLLAVAWSRGNKKWTRIFLSMLIALSIAGLAARAIKISVGEIGRGLERPALELQISRVSIRTRDCFDRVLCRPCFCELANRSAVFDDPDFNRLLAHLRRSALFIGRGLCSDSWNLVCTFGLALYPSQNRKSKIRNHKLAWRRGSFAHAPGNGGAQLKGS